MGTLPGVGFVLCHQVCQTRHGKKITSISAHFLFKVRCDKWPVSVPPEQNMTPAEAACPCFQSLPAFSFFFFFNTHTSLPLSFHLNSIFLSSLEDPLPFFLHFPLSSSSPPHLHPPQTRERSQHYPSRRAGEG